MEDRWKGSTRAALRPEPDEICRERKIKYNELATVPGVTPSTVYSMMDEGRKDVSMITVKKLCDGLDILLEEFFYSELFQNLEQEMQ